MTADPKRPRMTGDSGLPGGGRLLDEVRELARLAAEDRPRLGELGRGRLQAFGLEHRVHQGVVVDGPGGKIGRHALSPGREIVAAAGDGLAESLRELRGAIP